MKITVNIEDGLLLAAKRAALDRGTTLRAVLESGLRRELATPPRRLPLRLATVPGGAPDWVRDRQRMLNWLDGHRPRR